MSTILAVSPHLDDAIFSAGGAIARRVREGDRVVVATMCTGSVADPRGFALACQLDKGLPATVDYMALRRDEDRRACAVLGAEPIWLPLLEAPHRGYEAVSDLFGPVREDDDIVATLVLHLRGLIERVVADEIWGPQAIGAHVDHVVVLDALLRLDRPLNLWTDHPYAIRPAVRPSPRENRLACGRSNLVRMTRDDRQRKVEAAVAYTSQLGFQFGGIDAARTAIFRHGDEESFLSL